MTFQKLSDDNTLKMPDGTVIPTHQHTARTKKRTGEIDWCVQAIEYHLGNDIMVVIAGNGHIIRKFGIPNRAFKRSQAAFRTIYLATPGMKVSVKDGDFIWVTPSNENMGRIHH